MSLPVPSNLPSKYLFEAKCRRIYFEAIFEVMFEGHWPQNGFKAIIEGIFEGMQQHTKCEANFEAMFESIQDRKPFQGHIRGYDGSKYLEANFEGKIEAK